MRPQRGPRPRIELVYDRDCPNAERARAAIREALVAIGAPFAWREWDCAADDTPVALKTLGSPTILVNGHDVAGHDGSAAHPGATACRIYRDGCGCLCGAPPVELILDAIAGHVAPRENA